MSFDDLVQLVAARTGTPAKDLLGKSRAVHLQVPRRILWLMAIRHCNLGAAQLGERVGKHPHSIRHGLYRIQQVVDTEWQARILAINDELAALEEKRKQKALDTIGKE